MTDLVSAAELRDVIQQFKPRSGRWTDVRSAQLYAIAGHLDRIATALEDQSTVRALGGIADEVMGIANRDH